MMAAPSLRSVPISPSRKASILSELQQEFQRRATGRKILRTVRLEQDPRRAGRGEFRKIGINHVVDKVWFVDDPPGEDGYYGTAGIGTNYAIGLAEAESRAVVLKLLEATAGQEEIRYSERLGPEALIQAMRVIQRRGYTATSALTNTSDFSDVWYFPRFASGVGADIRVRVESREIPLYSSWEQRLEGYTFLVDGNMAGTIVLKKDLDADISEIAESEEERLSQVLNLPRDQLARKVRVYIEEVFRVDIDDPNAIVRMKKQETDRGST